MRHLELIKVVVALAVGLSAGVPAFAQLRRDSAPLKLGAQGPEGSPHRRQEWQLPTADQITASRALLFRPDGKGPFRLAVIAHDSPATRQVRAQMPQPDYPALTSALIARGFAVLIPQRLGHGKTGGPFLEDPETCDAADYAASAQTIGEAIVAALTYLRTQPFVRKEAAVVIGHGAGGWGALSLADQSVKNISAIVVFAPGRDARRDRDKRDIGACAMDKFLDVIKDFGDGAKVPVTWIVAENDLLYPPEFSKTLADAYRDAGGKIDFQLVSKFAEDGHALIETQDAAIIEPLLATVPELNAAIPVARVAAPAPAGASGQVNAAPKDAAPKSFLQKILPSRAKQ
jgi:dienelactone hydrolase